MYYEYMIKNFQGRVFRAHVLYNEDSWDLEEVLEDIPKNAIALNRVTISGNIVETIRKFN